MTVTVVGAGLAGCVIAERLAAHGHHVQVLERRSHFGGNCFDELNEHGVLVHRYGPHVLHTASERVWAYLSRFTAWWPYDHRVLAQVAHGADSSSGSLFLPVPPNRTTLERFFDIELTSNAAAASLLDKIREPIANPANSEERVLSRVGRQLYEAMFEAYTCKHWARHPRDLDAGVAGRIGVRTSRDDRYFVDAYRGQPADGFTAMFDRMLYSPRIDISLDTDGSSYARASDHVVWTGCVDEAFDYKHGRLPWRSVRFEQIHIHSHGALVQPCAVINACDGHVPHVRSTEYRWMTGQAHTGTTLQFQYPGSTGADAEPFYPVPAPDARAQHELYVAEAKQRADWTFCGRLARYQYLEMGQVVAQALHVADELLAAVPV